MNCLAVISATTNISSYLEEYQKIKGISKMKTVTTIVSFEVTIQYS